MAHFQVDSFVTKFKHLCHAGFKATLTITSSDGEASVVLTAGLGPIPPTQLQHDLRNHVQPRPRGPAYQRRQARRQAARTAEQASAEQASAEQPLQNVMMYKQLLELPQQLQLKKL